MECRPDLLRTRQNVTSDGGNPPGLSGGDTDSDCGRWQSGWNGRGGASDSRGDGIGADAVITMDGDLSHDAAILPKLLAGLERADLVIGSRNCQGSSLVENWPRHRLLISRMAGTLVELCPGAPVRDTTIGYRCWSREL